MKLHYSQTSSQFRVVMKKFDYHMKLHYSQTRDDGIVTTVTFDYHMKLHYSQTPSALAAVVIGVGSPPSVVTPSVNITRIFSLVDAGSNSSRALAKASS